MTDTEKLDALRLLHDTWGDTDVVDLDVQTMWEDLGFILGTIKAAAI